MEHELSEKALSLKHGVYQHFKGGLYQVLGVGSDSETQKEVVIYQALYGSFGLWVRPLEMFMEEVVKEDYLGPRFKFIGPNR
jgi:hypothetical protein